MLAARLEGVIFVCWVVLVGVGYPPGSVLGRAVPHHRRRGDGVGTLHNATLDNRTLSTVSQLGTSGEMLLEGCHIDHFGPALFSMLQQTDCLTLRGGLIPSVTFQSQLLDTLVIDATGLRTFEVDPFETPYAKLRILQITRNALEHLTPRLALLVGLRRLDLSQNRLTIVDLDVMRPLERLRDLDLSVNRIVRFDASPTPELRLAGLRNLWVSYNRLHTFEEFPGAFPALDTVRLIGNAWHCRWVDRARADIMRHGITAFGADYDCPGERQGGLCCFDDAPLGEQDLPQSTELPGAGWAAGEKQSNGDLTLGASNRSGAVIGVRYRDVEIFL
ncbi:insulin-like growth factor-binding protein complex acid labile subunit [Anopheles nili]|uniref:insulin-like growth factor-binding protein complex acid labile subunit n=1 Tax=Anopheles nili TaxID=185578 RepID=UPI00237A17E1|nr:insulin-like growth factor-binding protein complex acid labile subunit [Anopheles nili]